MAAVLIAAVPLLVVAAVRDAGLLALGLPLLAAAVAAAVVLAGVVAQRAARPVEELAEAAGRLGTGDPRPVGRRYGVTELDQVADGLDSVSRRVTNLLTADRELAIDASHQLRTPLTALSMRLEEMIASADDPDAVREEGTAALAQAERLAEVVTQLLSPARRVGAGSAGLISVDKIVLQQITEWEPAFRRAGRKMVLIGESRLQAYVTPGGLAQVIATLLDNALMHGKGTVTIRRTQSASSVVIEVEDEGNGVPAELVSRIFERSVSGRPEGTGLGLALARTMATADGGRIVLARRRPPVFAVFLPRNPPAGQAKASSSGPACGCWPATGAVSSCGGARAARGAAGRLPPALAAGRGACGRAGAVHGRGPAPAAGRCARTGDVHRAGGCACRHGGQRAPWRHGGAAVLAPRGRAAPAAAAGRVRGRLGRREERRVELPRRVVGERAAAAAAAPRRPRSAGARNTHLR